MMTSRRNLNKFAAAALVLASTSANAEFQWPHLGADIHFLKLTTGAAGEVGKSGFDVDGKIGTFFLQRSWEAETNLGMRYSTLSGTQLNVTQKLEHFSAMFELIPRFRLSPTWSLGPSFTMLFGSDMTHNEGSETNNSMLFQTGLSGHYRFTDSGWSLVLNGKKELNLTDRGLWSFGAGFLYRFGRGEKLQEYSAPEPVVAFEESAFEVPVEEPRMEINFEQESQTLVVRLPEGVLLFETGMSHLEPHQQDYVRRIGYVLNDNQGAWERMIIQGHTDYRGIDAVNQELSDGRAASVRAAIVSAGVNPDLITHEGLGESQPIAQGRDPESLSKNRRVEIKIEGVQENTFIQEELMNIRPQSP